MEEFNNWIGCYDDEYVRNGHKRSDWSAYLRQDISKITIQMEQCAFQWRNWVRSLIFLLLYYFLVFFPGVATTQSSEWIIYIISHTYYPFIAACGEETIKNNVDNNIFD